MSELQNLKDKLNKVSPSFCIAKWKQVTIHLESGLTHSCHHPKAHTIPLDELKKSPSALHNTNYKKDIRRKMLEGEYIEECEYCNGIDRNSKQSFSDRVYKSNEYWARKYLHPIIEDGWDHNTFPSYLEVSFSHVCTCQCIYCGSTFSSKWGNEIKKFGGYPVKMFNRDFLESPEPEYGDNDNNPYIKAFWEWWPYLYKNLEVFRITGGEPLLSQNTFKILDYIIDNPRQNLDISINSNLCVGEKILTKFFNKMKTIANVKKDRTKFKVFTSCEAVGKKAEYIRHGMNYKQWMKNCKRFLEEVPHSKLSFMCTYNILSITSFIDFLKDVLKLKKLFPLRVHIDIPYLMNPTYLNSSIITKDFLKYVEECVTFMYTNRDVPEWEPMSGVGFYDHESEKMRRVYNIIKHKPENINVLNLRLGFVKFIDEWDRRHETNFLNTFPEYNKFYQENKNDNK